MALPMYRADHVGSFLRPSEVLQAHKDFADGKISAAQRDAIVDAGVLKILQVQREVGVDVLSDGEYRRGNWAGDFSEAVDGYVSDTVPIHFEWRMPDDTTRVQNASAEWIQAMPHQAGRVIGARIQQRHRLTAHEAAFIKAQAGSTPYKVTLPAGSYVVARGWKPGITDKAYASRWELTEHVAQIVRAEVDALQAEGVPYIQIDNPHWPDYIPEDRRAEWRSIGVDPDKAMDEDIRGDNLAVAGVDRSKVTLATHICRGNGRSAWHTQGGYDSIAEKVFGGLDVDRFLLEYDTDRAGGFEPLRFIPKGRQVVLGLVTTKVGELESQDLLLKRIEEASKYVPIENLALSPQCGFASVDAGNLLSWDEQRRKLELVVETARKVWG